jgi:hypothetical protein
MRKKKISKMNILRFINLYDDGSYSDEEALSFEISRMKQKDRPRCCMVTSDKYAISTLAKIRNANIALICNRKHVIRIFKTDAHSDYNKKGAMKVYGGGSDMYSECWVKSGKDCYIGIAVVEWFTVPYAERLRISTMVLKRTSWTSILDLSSGKTIDLIKWKSGAK